jgi:hypothetical protein
MALVRKDVSQAPSGCAVGGVRSFRVASCLFFIATLLTGCGPSSTDVGKSTKASLQQYLDTNSDLKTFHLTVTEVTAIKVGENSYEGMAIVSSPSAQHNIQLKIIADGHNTIWSAEPSAFAPFLLDAKLAADSPAPSQNHGNTDMDLLNESPGSWAVKAIQETYKFAPTKRTNCNTVPGLLRSSRTVSIRLLTATGISSSCIIPSPGAAWIVNGSSAFLFPNGKPIAQSLWTAAR